MMSYAGTLFMGVHVDPAAVTDTGLLMRSLREGFAELIAAAGVTVPETPSEPSAPSGNGEVQAAPAAETPSAPKKKKAAPKKTKATP
jgi:hypothetical protein